MKHIIILGDGMADWPAPSLNGKTLLQYAYTPYMDMLAAMGQTGMLKTVADGFHPGSEVANMSVMAMICRQYMKDVEYLKPPVSEWSCSPVIWRCVVIWFV